MQNWAALALVALIHAGCSSGDSTRPTESVAGATPVASQAGEEGTSTAADAEHSPPAANDADRLLRLAQADLTSGNPEQALARLREIPRDGSPTSSQAAQMAGRIHESQGRLSAAIAAYEYVLDCDPDQSAARGHLAEVYALTGQRWEADVCLRQVVRTPDLGFKQLVLLTDFERRHGDDLTVLQRLETQAPDDPAVQLGLAVEDFEHGKIDSARRRLEAVIASEPELAPAQALLGEILLLEASQDELLQWHGNLQESVGEHPAIWYVRGLWAQQLNEPAVAARCLWESARQTPTSYRAIHQLGRVLSPVDAAAGEAFATRAEELHQMKQLLSRALDSGGRDETALRGLVEHLLDSGREWEAWSWTIMAQSKYPRSPWIRQVLERLSEYPHTSAPRILDSSNLVVTHDLAHYPDFASILPKVRTLAGTPSHSEDPARISFEDVAESLGLVFTYHRGRVAGTHGVRMQESTGGGVGVLDYDNDGRPDLFFTQGENWPENAIRPTGSREYQDALHRNVGRHFENVTVPTRVPAEDGFGQGCGCGDFNNDGFPDIYVANIGVNQLLINNGDGTFEDWTSKAGLAHEAWTTSCLIADLNGDGAPDLFDVNYVEGEFLFQKICDETECSPEAYSGSADQFLLSLGDGTTQRFESRPDDRVGAGLGVVVFRAGAPAARAVTSPDGAGRADQSVPPPGARATGPLALFVANDQDPNFLLQIASSDDPQDVSVTDASFLAGLALNRDGDTTACMGVASGDLTGDGQLDLLVTNYKDEANTLFVQQDTGLFTDAIGGSGLMSAGLPYVGWGTQAFDADNDGRLDLAVTNGHVGEFANREGQYRMPTQFFHNLGAGRFHELAAQTLGDFFSRRILGRSVATLDWNRDGRVDFAVGLLDENVALLNNQTTAPGNWLTLRLHGTAAARDPIGTFVTVTTDREVLCQQLTAGNGYQATNERVVHFGLGDSDIVRKLTVDWPNGLAQTFLDLPANRLFIVVEDGGCLPAFVAAADGQTGR